MSLAGQTALVEARARALPGQGASSAKVTRPFEATNKEELFKGDELWVRRKRLRRR